MMQKDIYISELNRLKAIVDGTKNTPFTMYAKVVTLANVNMRYEKVAFSKNLDEHPYILTKKIIQDAIIQFNAMSDIAFIESDDKTLKHLKSHEKEEKHQNLFNEMWNRYGDKEFEEYIDRYVHRIKINNLGELIKDKICCDLGCGNGNFCFALLREGARRVVGIDFGEKSIKYAQNYAERNGLSGKALFKHTTVYDTGLQDNYCDFAIQNGVFHHLDDEDKAIREAKRILKRGGWFWYYTDGEGGISYDLWDASVHMLSDVPILFIENIFNSMNVSRNKIVHLTDGLSATYAHTSWKKITNRLSKHGFGNFKRLTGGFDTDFDLDRIEADPYGKEKFGEGDLRILCQRVDL